VSPAGGPVAENVSEYEKLARVPLSVFMTPHRVSGADADRRRAPGLTGRFARRRGLSQIRAHDFTCRDMRSSVPRVWRRRILTVRLRHATERASRNAMVDLRRVLSSRRAAALWTPLLGNRIPVFALHRFAAPELGIGGHDPRVLRAMLERLRRDRYALLGLGDALRYLLTDTAPPARSVVFTIDDGYTDLSLVAAELFLEYDCPVTVFVTTGFVDGQLWPWWDQIEFVCLHARVPAFQDVPGGPRLRLPLGGAAERQHASRTLSAYAKRLREEEKRGFIEHLALEAKVKLPTHAPAAYRAMSWSDARTLERRGFSFAPHSVSHPILSRLDEAQARAEIRDSWRSLVAELSRPVPVFAYPNGGSDDHGPREYRLLAELGLSAAVTMSKGYACGTALTRTPHARFQIPRFGFPTDADRVCLIASGFERIASLVRRRTLERAV
jgi:peptidoglycan/xylan/chitin deacetylase (PgdA/CDA1 family)